MPNEKILSAVKSARETFEKAQKNFSTKGEALTKKANSSRFSLNYMSTYDVNKVNEIIKEGVELSRDFYVACETLIGSLDMLCRPLLEQKPSAQAVGAIASLIDEIVKDLDDTKVSFNVYLNGSQAGSAESDKFKPSIESRVIQSFWNNTYHNMPGYQEEEQRKKDEKLREKQREEETLQKAEQAKKDLQNSVESIFADDRAVEERRNALKNECEHAVKNFEAEAQKSFELFVKELPGMVAEEIKYLDASLAELRAEMKHADRKTKPEYVHKIQDIEDEKIIVSAYQYIEAQTETARRRVEKAVDAYRAQLDSFVEKCFYTQKKDYTISAPNNPKDFFVPELTAEEQVVYNHISWEGYFKSGDSIDEYFDSHRQLLSKALYKLMKYGMIYRIEAGKNVYFIMHGKSITITNDAWVEDKEFSCKGIPKATPVCFTEQSADTAEYKNPVHFANKSCGSSKYKKEQMGVMERERKIKKQKRKKMTRVISTLVVILMIGLTGLLTASFVGFKQAEVKAIYEIENNQIEESIKTLLEAGVPVEITYNFAGGTLNNVSRSTYGYMLSLDTSIVPVATENTDDTKEEQKVFVYKKLSDFSGLHVPEKSGYNFSEWEFVDYSYKLGGVFKLELKATWEANKYNVTFDDTAKANVIVTFNGNYSGAGFSNIVVYKGDTLAYPAAPKRDGYVFTGWYTDSECTSRYDFSGTLTEDLTLYACWKAQKADSVYSNTIILPSKHASSSNHYSISTRYTSSSEKVYIYLVAGEAGEHKIHYANSSSYDAYYLHIYNLTTGTILIGNDSVDSYSYAETKFECSAGDVIVIELYKTGTSSYDYSDARFYFEGFSALESTAKSAPINDCPEYVSGSKYNESYTFDDQYMLPEPIRDGYVFLGWYNGAVKMESGIWNIASDITLVSKWEEGDYAVTLDANGGTVSTDTIAVTFDKDYTLPTPTRTGYTFDGWYNGETKYDGGKWSYGGDITLTAKWIADNTITLDANGGIVSVNSVVVAYAKESTLPIPTRTGYVFDGWYNGETKYESIKWSSEGDITLTAKWIANKYNVTFDDVRSDEIFITYNYNYSGANDIIVALADGEVLAYPSIPQRSGYVFAGWYTDSACTEKYNFTGEISIDMTLYAKWIETSMKNVYSEIQIDPGKYTSSSNAYTVSTNGTSSSAKKYIYFVAEEAGIHYIYFKNSTSYPSYYLQIDNLTDGTIVKSSTDISSTSYSYVKFACGAGDIFAVSLYSYSSYSGSEADFYFEGFDSITSSASADTSATIVDSEKNKENIVVTLDHNYSGSTSTKVTLANGQTLTYPTVPTRTGYAFAGWYTNNLCTAQYNFKGAITEDMTLYAKWVPMTSTYSKIEYVDIANYNSSSSKKEVNITASSEESQDYYYFTCYIAGTYNFYFANTAGDFYLTVYNVTKDSCIIEKSNLDRKNSSKSTSVEVEAGDVICVSLYMYYSGDSSASGEFYVENINYPESTAIARYKEYSYYADATVSTMFTFGNVNALPVPVRTGYTFLGWYNGETKIEGAWNTASDVTLTAKWKVTENTITLDANGGDVTSNSIAVTYDQEYTLPTPTRTGYTFDGWYDGETKYESGTWLEENDVTLTAKWKANIYNITYDDTVEIKDSVDVIFDHNYTGSVATTVTLTSSETLTYPEVPMRTGYAFAGWYTDSDCTTQYSFSGDITKDITLYAKWVAMSSSASTLEYVDIANYNSSASKKTVNVSSYSSSKQEYYYFTCYTEGTYTIYANRVSGDFYITVYNATKGTTIISRTNLDSSPSSTSTSFTAGAGDVIYISLYNYSSSSTSSCEFYVTDISYPISTATASCGVERYEYNSESTFSTTVNFGDMVALVTPVRTGYTFLGWYNGETKIESGEWNIASDVTFTPKWEENT